MGEVYVSAAETVAGEGERCLEQTIVNIFQSGLNDRLTLPFLEPHH